VRDRCTWTLRAQEPNFLAVEAQRFLQSRRCCGAFYQRSAGRCSCVVGRKYSDLDAKYRQKYKGAKMDDDLSL